MFYTFIIAFDHKIEFKHIEIARITRWMRQKIKIKIKVNINKQKTAKHFIVMKMIGISVF